MVDLMWATRGRSWGFRFLLDGGQPKPLSIYESVFVGAEGEFEFYRRCGRRVALRFLDPLERADAAGRVIPHDFVISGSAADSITSIGDGLREIWPIVAHVYAGVWDRDKPPTISEVLSATAGDQP